MDDSQDLVRDIIGGEEEEGELLSEFLGDFLSETRDHLQGIEVLALDLEANPGKGEALNGIFRSFHTIKGLAGFVSQSLIQKVAHRTETLLDHCRKGRCLPGKPIIDAVLASTDLICRVCGDLSLLRDEAFVRSVEDHLRDLEESNWESLCGVGEEASPPPLPMPSPRLGELLVEEDLLSVEEVAQLLELQQEVYPELKLGQVVVREGAAPARSVVASLREQKVPREEEVLSRGGDFVRIPVHKVDSLVDMLGELLINQSQVEQVVLSRFGPNDSLVARLMGLSRITRDLQNLSMSLSMISLRTTLQKIQRVARDTLQGLGKKVDFRISGEETEIDRGVAEKLLDPLVHLVKNALAHGIESPTERLQAGKTPSGLVRIEACSRRGNVYIEVSDDGRGIDTEKVLLKARERDLADPARNYSDEEIINFIFLPGFSTVSVADDISGRGVGMDVVRTEVSKIGGKVEIRNAPGAGCTFILKIPINMAVLNGTVVDILGGHYIVPTLNVKRILKPEAHHWVSVGGREIMIRVRDSVVPVVAIGSLFGRDDFDRERDGALMVLVELEQEVKALPVRSVIGRQEIVVKPLGKEFGSLDFVAGASILGDGKVSLILDVEALFRDGGDGAWSSSAANI